jgi:hypothetical protein
MRFQLHLLVLTHARHLLYVRTYVPQLVRSGMSCRGWMDALHASSAGREGCRRPACQRMSSPLGWIGTRVVRTYLLRALRSLAGTFSQTAAGRTSTSRTSPSRSRPSCPSVRTASARFRGRLPRQAWLWAGRAGESRCHMRDARRYGATVCLPPRGLCGGIPTCVRPLPEILPPRSRIGHRDAKRLPTTYVLQTRSRGSRADRSGHLITSAATARPGASASRPCRRRSRQYTHT